jgi:hypothetical protein
MTETLTEGKVFDTIHKLRYDLFKRIMVEGDLSLLVESGKASPEYLSATWQEILFQYGESLGNSIEDAYYYTTFREYLHLTGKIEKIDKYLQVLRKVFVIEWMRELMALVDKTTPDINSIDPQKKDEYFKLLEVCEKRAKGIKMRYSFAEMKLLSLKDKRGDKTETIVPTYESFERTEIHIDDFKGRAIDYETISTFKYCELLRQLNKFADKQNNSTKSKTK